MRVRGEPRRTIWLADDGRSVCIIDQTRLPHEFVIEELRGLEDAARAISSMQVRGAPLIGVTAAYGLALAMRDDASDAAIDSACARLIDTRPTAVNLGWALATLRGRLADVGPGRRAETALALAGELAEEDVSLCRAIGLHGAELLAALRTGAEADPLQILTHCNAGWLATVDWGTALAPIYVAHERGMPLHVWVDETRPRRQGASLTAWELREHGIAHTVIVDSAGGHLMRQGRVDVCITGSDRTTASGDVCNKIGTYEKALAARDCGIPFYVALPHSSIDWSLDDGMREIPIEERPGEEVTFVTGLGEDGEIRSLRVVAEGSPVANPAFDVTPARLVTGLITERGVCAATREGLLGLYPEPPRVVAVPGGG